VRWYALPVTRQEIEQKMDELGIPDTRHIETFGETCAYLRHWHTFAAKSCGGPSLARVFHRGF
jgi:hypothetical protein